VAGYLGALMCVVASLVAIVGVLVAALPATGAAFWFLGAAILLTGGLNLGFLSVMGEYVWRAGDDARRRPIYVVRSVADVAGPAAAATPNSTVVHAVDEHRARSADARSGSRSVDAVIR
jgi:dolichol-phosphate mannosyltransferase